MGVMVEYKFLPWAVNILAVCIGILIVCMAIWLVLEYIRDNLKKAIRLENMKTANRVKAHSAWESAYLAEKKAHNKTKAILNEMMEKERRNSNV